MKMNEIKEIAVDRGVRPGKLKKTDLVRSIQQAEGNPECFMTGILDQCEEDKCLWREDCC